MPFGGLIDLSLVRRPAVAALAALAAGLFVGPLAQRVLPGLLETDSPLESFAEIALLVSLFSLGLRLQTPLRWSLWRLPVRLATLGLLATLALSAAATHLIFGIGGLECLLLAAILAPTDARLAAELPHSEEAPAPRFIVAAESGLNNALAAALVAVVLGLMGLEPSGEPASVAMSAAWALAGGAAAGWLAGAAMARCLSSLDPDRRADFLEEALVFAAGALAYGIALTLGANGFLSVLVAGLALSHGGRLRPLRNRALMPRTLRLAARCEDYSRLGVLFLVGMLLAEVDIKGRTLLFALVSLLLIRPLAVRLAAGAIGMNEQAWRSAAWLTARSLAPVYCLGFSLNHGLPSGFAHQLSAVTLVVIVCSMIRSAVSDPALSRAPPGAVDSR
jgi:sodium/hydrogen antiporter